MSFTQEEILDFIQQSPDYKLIRKYNRVEYYNEPNEKEKLIGIYVDTETTGSFTKGGKLIEIALVPFEYDSEGKIYRILESYVSFQDPGTPVPEFITKLTGIDTSMVKGQSIDVIKVNDLVNKASIIIAHHAPFDKKFVERSFPIFKEKTWGCSVAHVPWKKEGISSAKLEFIAYSFGIFYDAHRAEIDSLVGIHILSQKLLISGELAFKVLLDNAEGKNYRIWAENAPYEKKDILKARGYKWSNGARDNPKSWYKIIKEDSRQKELIFLYEEIYKEFVDLRIDETESFKRL